MENLILPQISISFILKSKSHLAPTMQRGNSEQL